jgi:predicted alpha-1,2-mannosidase
MSGYHSVSVIADAIIKGVYTGDPYKALEACVTTARHRNYEGIGEYMNMGFIPSEKSNTSVSNTLEYAYDDWCIAQLAKKLGRQDIYDEFHLRSDNWQNNFNVVSGFMQPKTIDGEFKNVFDPLSTNGQGFIEGNSWNYSFFVPQDPKALVEKMGGDKLFIARLDTLFTMRLPDEFFAETEDITREGIIGGYVHGNEPAHHVAYLYNWTSKPWKTQAQVRHILNMQYKRNPDGLGGNDDCGQMSAWYIFSSLGFYPVAPGSDQYALGSPAVNEATLYLENGKTFSIKTINQGKNNVYVEKVLLNGKPLEKPFINHSDITNGSTLTFYMKQTSADQ